MPRKKIQKYTIVYKRKSRKRRYDLEPIPKNIDHGGKGVKVLELREVLWDNTLSDVLHFERPVTVTIGTKRNCTLRLYDDKMPKDVFPLIEPAESGGIKVNFTREMEGQVIEGYRSFSFKEAIETKKATQKNNIYNLEITPEMAIVIKFGSIKYYLHFVSKEKLNKVPLLNQIDYPFTSISLILAMTYLCSAAYLRSMPSPEIADILDDETDERTMFVPNLIDNKDEPTPVKTPKKLAKKPGGQMDSEGKIGEEKSDLDKTKGSARKRLEDKQVAHGAGILGALDSGDESMDMLFGSGSLGSDLDKMLGMTTGLSGMSMRGTGGLGSRGAGLGGVGSSLGIGGLGTRGRGGKNSRYGFDAGDNLKKRKFSVKLDTKAVAILGGMDKSVISRIIKKRHSQFRYCYQKELNKNPGLYGKVSVKFTISPDGSVRSSVIKVSTMRNHNVEECVAKTMKRIIFPKPYDNGYVIVTYPFLFNSAAG